MAEDDAGVVGARSTVVGAVADAGEAMVGAEVMAMKSSKPVVQVIWPMVNVRPFSVAMEPGMMTILFVWGALCRDSRRNMVSSLPRGMPKVVDYRQTGAQATNEMVTQDRHKVLSRFGRREGVIPTSYV